jgi:hypothetical protein
LADSVLTLPTPTKAEIVRSWLALAAQLSNPKTQIMISGIYAALLPNRLLRLRLIVERA